ncbi:hypothetical protein [Kribbella sp. CA-293567]|uniref:hypothetical protein n=1 Tax=Kribbella sp. CA-293567 TaxID=3002436 RepID=UPI0022DD2687|nr:hypothetical protein [Kribbella sp. CA-293567]WBQ03101.1 hypothetical protein OX958_24340 [Kribbella sp. CA-293567]
MSAQRAAELADHVAQSIQEARGSLTRAANAAEDLGQVTRQIEGSVEELNYSGSLAGRSDDPARFLRDAQDHASDVYRRLGQGEELIGDVRSQLDQTRDRLTEGRRSLDELTQVPEQRSEVTAGLRQRLDTLDAAVRTAGRQVEQVSRKFAVAQGNVEPMVDQARNGNLQDLTSSSVASTGRSAEQNVQQAKSELRNLREGFDEAGPVANQAQRDAVELDRLARVGFNPPIGQRTSAGSAETAYRGHAGGPDRQNTPER